MPQLNDRLIAEIVSKVRISGSVDTGLAACGVERETFAGWRESFRRGGADALVIRLMDAIAEAEAEVKMVREHQLAKYFEKNWQALAWWLERKYPDEYGPRAKEKSSSPAAPLVPGDDDMDSLFSLLPKG